MEVGPKILKNLTPEMYQHPLEKTAFDKLLKTRGLKRLVDKFHEIGIEDNMRWQYQSSSIKVTHNNFNHLQFLCEKAADILQVDRIPDLYIQRGDQLQGLSIGIENTMIILSSEAVDQLTNQELLFVIGREIAHLAHQHTLYKEIGLIFPDLMEAFSVVTLGLSSLVSTGLKYALFNWDRTSDYTADRGGLLSCQDPQVALRFMAKLAGWPRDHWESINLQEFETQVTTFEAGSQKTFDKIINYMLGSNTWAIERAKELHEWIEEGEYGSIVDQENR